MAVTESALVKTVRLLVSRLLLVACCLLLVACSFKCISSNYNINSSSLMDRHGSPRPDHINVLITIPFMTNVEDSSSFRHFQDKYGFYTAIGRSKRFSLSFTSALLIRGSNVTLSR